MNDILVIEDDALLNETLVDLFECEGFHAIGALSAEEAIEITFQRAFDLYIVDINLPMMNGIELLTQLRQAGDNTIAFFLTSYHQKAMLLKAFSVGADEYLQKPFDNAELLARISALFRRHALSERIACGDIEINTAEQTVFFKKQLLQLAPKSYLLLLLLVRHVNKIVSFDDILQTLYDGEVLPDSGVIRVYVARIKKQIPDIHIENVRARGYRLVT